MFVLSIGDISEVGVLCVVELIWGDLVNDCLLIVEEDEIYVSEFKVYILVGRFIGIIFGCDVFKVQVEGVMLWICGKDGWWIIIEQGKQCSVFYLFDCYIFKYVGVFQGNMVVNIDGIWFDLYVLLCFFDGVLYVVYDDQGVVVFDWVSVVWQLLLLLECVL